MKRLLIVDDEAAMRKLVKIYLLQDNYQVDEAADGQEALRKIEKNDYDLMILDVMMPVMDGWQTIERVRETSEIPIILLTAKGTVEDKVTGLSAGADDYLVKPFDEAELLVRVKALLRRTFKKESVSDEAILKCEGVLLNLTAREASFEGKTINLTPTEFELLEILLKHRGRVFSREKLVERIWGIEFKGEDRTVDVHVKNLREKLKSSGMGSPLIKTVWGIGYKVE